jgi:predicted kinase
MSLTISRSKKPSVACPAFDSTTAPADFLKRLRANSAQPMIAMLIGPPASGKSTFRDAYMAGNRYRTVVFSTDDRIEDWGRANGLNYSEAFGKVNFKVIEKEMFSEFDQAARNGYDLVADRTNMTVGSRSRWFNRLPDAANWLKVAVVFEVPDDELRERLDRRGKATGKTIPWSVVQNMKTSYEEPLVDNEFDWVIRA